MKSFTVTLAATMVVGAAASHGHGHQHLHAKKDASRIEARAAPDVVTKFVPGPTAVVYQLAGEIVDNKKAEEGLKDGEYVVIGETTPTFVAPPPPPKPTTKDQGAQFIEKPKSSAAAPPPKPSEAPKPAPKVAQAASSSGATGLNAPFPDGVLDCTEFPSKYGAVPVDYLGMHGWIGIQNLPGFTLFSGSAISKIITGIAGDNCSKGSTCSYACPHGYQKSQWPASQGATGQSIGGIYCNADGKLVLTRPEVKTLCIPGEGGVSIQNDLNEFVATCRTDYPGTESMVIPAGANPGETIPLTNPSQKNYYFWKGLTTSAQYYVNPRGFSLSEGCRWVSPKGPTRAGNWAPMNLGTSVSTDGNTYISIFDNAPTSSAKLDFNVEIIGDVSVKCSYKNGVYYGGSATGCTTTIPKGGKAIVRYF
ncbi:hypothetical protein VHEMI05989 [[Torrubiella] hemipterigena]|uniref:SUN domain-containing protein n=1 Tax=[Torrubiella] hemipterigena TaxID=1531966 RepID=A0A0A1TI34_9HYPO|nr:hypothetical protein VHEMI05989 [[Torrubiella] hemipterigena]